MSERTTPHRPQPEPQGSAARPLANGPMRTLIAMIVVALAFAAVAVQLVRLALPWQPEITSSLSEVVDGNVARPDIVDRNGRLLASDVEAYSLFADPARVLDRDEVVEKLKTVFSDLDQETLRKDLGNKQRRFVWIRRGISPKMAQAVHDLGLPGLDFRRELRRAYPGGALAGHVLGYVNVDNRGVQGIERYVDDVVGVEPVRGATLSDRAPVRLSLDIGVQHAVEAELKEAMDRYGARGAAGIVLDASSGEVLASASMPEVDPAFPGKSLEKEYADKVAGSTFELGSVFKTVTLAMVMEYGLATLDSMVDATQPITAGRFTIKDFHPLGRRMTLSEVFVHSSNIGAAKLALLAGPQRLRTFLQQLQLMSDMRTEAGPVASPQLPERWGDIETMTIGFGHGIALSPLQFAAAAATLVNGGNRIVPTYIKKSDETQAAPVPVVSKATSARVRELMRRNVVDPAGTGKRAEVTGYLVGGKTGTAEIPGIGGYRQHSVISSFLSAFPINRPKYLVFVLLFEPARTEASGGEVVAGLNAAPTTGRIISRIGPLLRVLPTAAAIQGTTPSGVAFDASPAGKYQPQ